ncbi:hypothetical protein BDZ90DRAFT_69359 [Jaminaea rosea]|uniref:Myb-like domain-containing protein n=1 Tax=Jaminaea rosea TaxID=1569628 RepID=A0A316UR48_9BASI|nr:hypothetical protein BDZ90DRAFT_69359 [Jaminaea rosea]PWN25605.1 hypothetical protein BDZ90DRAFT_69359 [Jaminaea rosea]
MANRAALHESSPVASSRSDCFGLSLLSLITSTQPHRGSPQLSRLSCKLTHTAYVHAHAHNPFAMPRGKKSTMGATTSSPLSVATDTDAADAAAAGVASSEVGEEPEVTPCPPARKRKGPVKEERNAQSYDSDDDDANGQHEEDYREARQSLEEAGPTSSKSKRAATTRWHSTKRLKGGPSSAAAGPSIVMRGRANSVTGSAHSVDLEEASASSSASSNLGRGKRTIRVTPKAAAAAPAAAAGRQRVKAKIEASSKKSVVGKGGATWSAAEDAIILEDMVRNYKPDWSALVSQIEQIEGGKVRTRKAAVGHWEQTLKKKILDLGKPGK